MSNMVALWEQHFVYYSIAPETGYPDWDASGYARTPPGAYRNRALKHNPTHISVICYI